MAEISENKPAKCLVLHFYYTRNIKDLINKIMVAGCRRELDPNEVRDELQCTTLTTIWLGMLAVRRHSHVDRQPHELKNEPAELVRCLGN